MTNKQPLVTILLPTYARNASGFLSAAIESVLKQTYSHYELLIIDDCSTDGSATTISDYSKQDSRVKHIRLNEHIGLPALSTAYGFRQSLGEFIAWQFDDCTWEPDHLETLINGIQENLSYGMVYGKCLCIMGDDIEPLVFGYPFERDKLLKGNNLIPNVASLIKRSVYEELGWVDPSIILKKINDFDMWKRIANKYSIGFCDKIIATEHGVSLQDSLGQSVSGDEKLILSYMETDRNEYLKISNYQHWNPYLFTPKDEYENIQFLKVAVEHIIRTRKYQDFVHIQEPFNKIATQYNMTPDVTLTDCLIWYHKHTSEDILKENAKLNKIILNLQNHIEQQRKDIDNYHLLLRLWIKLTHLPTKIAKKIEERFTGFRTKLMAVKASQ